MLPVGHVHVWRARLAHEKAARLLDIEVPVEERQTSRTDVSRLSRAYLLNILSRYKNVSAASFRLEREPDGKPFIRGGPGFNLAHTKDIALIAVSRTSIGVDLERIDRPIRHMDRLLSRFCEKERETVRQARDARQAFLALWTRKEAFVKCTGGGIRTGLDSFQVDLTQNDNWLLSVNGSSQTAREFYGCDLQVDQHVAAVVVRSCRPPEVRYFEWAAE